MDELHAKLEQRRSEMETTGEAAEKARLVAVRGHLNEALQDLRSKVDGPQDEEESLSASETPAMADSITHGSSSSPIPTLNPKSSTLGVEATT